LICAALLLGALSRTAHAQWQAVTAEPVMSLFGQMPSGSRNTDPFGGGKMDLYLGIDGEKLNLWQGISLKTHGELRGGSEIALVGGAALPVNTSVFTPKHSGTHVAVTGLYLEQEIGTTAVIQLGKINYVDLFQKEMVIGGSGYEGFEHIAFVASPNGLFPAATLGMLSQLTLGATRYTFGVYDPTSILSTSGLGHAFSNGASFYGAFRLSTWVGGLPGSHTLNGFATTREGLDFNNIPYFFLPNNNVQMDKKSPWFASYEFRQLVMQRGTNKEYGWGVYAQLGVSDANPNPIESTFIVAIGGTGLKASRPADRFGLGYFHYGVSDDLIAALPPRILVDQEKGAEMFYSFAVSSHVYIGANLEVVSPLTERDDMAYIMGIRTKVTF
jgi:porin